MRRFPREAAAALFLRRQHLHRPRALPFTPEGLERFVEDAGGIQLDSINAVERAHLLTLWSRFGPYDRAALEDWVYGRRLLVEYWAHAACLVPRGHLPAWRRAMLDYKTRHTGWAGWLRRNNGTLTRVEGEVRARGPLAGRDLERPARAKGKGWWDWDAVAHSLHYLWMSGRVAVHSRVNFQKVYDAAERVLPAGEPLPPAAFRRWHVETSLRAMGAATEKDLAMYLTFPRRSREERRAALAALLREGSAVELRLEGSSERWYALARDVAELERAEAAQGTTLLSPFDSLLWHRERARALFGFDYRIEVYVPEPKRRFGYYVLPILSDGRLIGRADLRNRRAERRLDVLSVHLEPGAREDAARPGVEEALRSLAAFLGAEKVRGPRSRARSRPRPASPAGAPGRS